MKWLLLSAFVFMITETQYRRSPVTDAECIWETYYMEDSVKKQGPYGIRVNYKKDTIIIEGWNWTRSKEKIIHQYLMRSDTLIIEGKSVYHIEGDRKLLYFNHKQYAQGDTFYCIEIGYTSTTWVEMIPADYSFEDLQEGSYIYKVRKAFIYDDSVKTVEEAKKVFADTSHFKHSEGIEAHHPILGITAEHTHQYHQEIINVTGDTNWVHPEFLYNNFTQANSSSDSIMTVLKKRLNF